MNDLLRILFADDCEISRNIIGMYLSEVDINVDFAVDGEEALRMFESRRYDLIILDNQMPKMYGVKVAEKIRAKSFTAPILLYSTDLSITEEERAFFTEILPKPISKYILLEKICQYKKRLRRDVALNVSNF